MTKFEEFKRIAKKRMETREYEGNTYYICNYGIPVIPECNYLRYQLHETEEQAIMTCWEIYRAWNK